MPRSRVDEIYDICVLLDRTLSLPSHAKRIALQAMRTLGLACRLSREFRTSLLYMLVGYGLCVSCLEWHLQIELRENR